MHILNGFNAEMCLGLTVTLITAPHTDKYAIATIKSYPIMGKIFLYLINKSIRGKKKLLTMVHFLKTLLQLQNTARVRAGVNTPSPNPPLQLFLVSLALSQKWFRDLKKKKLFCRSSLLYPSLISSESEKKQTPKRLQNWVLYKLREELNRGGAKVGGT